MSTLPFVTDKTAHNVLNSLLTTLERDLPTVESRRLATQRALRTCRGDALKRIRKVAEAFADNVYSIIGKTKKTSSGGGGYTLIAGWPVTERPPGGGWLLHIYEVVVAVPSKDIGAFRFGVSQRPKLTFYGHAIARFYQRAYTVKTEDVVYNMRLACRYGELILAAIDEGIAFKQVIIPTKNGSWCGDVEATPGEGMTLVCKTYLPDGNERRDRVKRSLLKTIDALQHPIGATTIDNVVINNHIVITSLQQLAQEEPWLLEQRRTDDVDREPCTGPLLDEAKPSESR